MEFNFVAADVLCVSVLFTLNKHHNPKGPHRPDAIRQRDHSRTQSPTYARCDEGLWPNPKPETIKTW